jgi:16S rRNA (cytosine967-C5)-methyltransferase
VLSPQEADWLARMRAVDPAGLPDKLRHNLPDWLAQPLRQALGEEEFGALVASLDAPAPLDLRANAWRAKREDVQAELAAARHRGRADALFALGPARRGKPALNRAEPSCAATSRCRTRAASCSPCSPVPSAARWWSTSAPGPGGKTLALGAMMRNTGRLYAFDVSGHRLAALKPRLARSGLATSTDADRARARRAHQAPGRQDRPRAGRCAVLGLGTLRRNPT